MRRPSQRTLQIAAIGGLVAASTALFVPPSSGAAAPVTPTTELQILSFNDYHGNLEPPAGANGRLPGLPASEGFGGAAYLSQTLKTLRAGHPNTLTVAAGDLIGASPSVSGIFHDEPSIETLNAMGLDASSVGNHEFDEGVPELLRMQYGGCHPTAGCFGAKGFAGAAFPYLAANVAYHEGYVPPRTLANGTVLTGYGSWNQSRTGRTVLAPTWTTTVNGVKVGFIGMTLKSTNVLVAQAGIQNVEFRDEIATANLAAQDLRQRGVEAIVVLVHEGGVPPSGVAYNFPCTGANSASSISGPIVTIAQNLDPSIDLVISGHTHQPYTCSIPDPAGRPRAVTSAMSYGRLVTNTTLSIDRVTKDVDRSSVTSVNVPVRRDKADSTVAAIVGKWVAAAAPVTNRPVGAITENINRGATRAVEGPLVNLIADAQLDRTTTNGAQIALMNPGGVRADLTYAGSSAGEGDGNVTYGEAFTVQPFANLLVTMTLTGAQLRAVLEQQWATGPMLTLGVSHGFTYAYSASAPLGARIDPASMKLNGVPIAPATNYRVTVNSFLADGGDGFAELVNGTDRVGGGVDLDEFVAWLGQNSPVSSPGIGRVVVLP